MDASNTLIIIGGIIVLVSVSSGILLQSRLERRKPSVQINSHSIQIVSEKQKEFIEKFTPVLLEIMCYLDKLCSLNLHGVDGPEMRREEASNAVSELHSKLTEYWELLSHYHIYLSKDLLEKAIDLHGKCFEAGSTSPANAFEQRLDFLSFFLNRIRALGGLDELPRHLFFPTCRNKK